MRKPNILNDLRQLLLIGLSASLIALTIALFKGLPFWSRSIDIYSAIDIATMTFCMAMVVRSYIGTYTTNKKLRRDKGNEFQSVFCSGNMLEYFFFRSSYDLEEWRVIRGKYIFYFFSFLFSWSLAVFLMWLRIQWSTQS